MGNKTKMLPLLGEVLLFHSKKSSRIADPFCGSGAVSWFLAESTKKEIISGDLQSFAVARARAVIERTEKFNPSLMIKRWFARAQSIVEEVGCHFPNNLKSIETDLVNTTEIRQVVNQSRKFCKNVLPVVFSNFNGVWPISKAYGGYYHSPVQALIFDALRQSLPSNPIKRKVALAALIDAVSKSAASPGHTAQPFQPTESAGKYIIEAWTRNAWDLVREATVEIANHAANTAGKGVVGSFEKTISLLSEGDLVFADPPYSDVHYSRFYHVLETVCRGTEFQPEGSGRYPSFSERPASAFSRKSAARNAAKNLLLSCSNRKSTLILTFPTKGASNGLDASDFIDIGTSLFSSIKVEEVLSDFSTLGGNKKNRSARQECSESIICFQP